MIQLIGEPNNIYTDVESKLKKRVKDRHHVP